MSKIGILYICTGRYSKFWKDFYKNCEKRFLPNSEKHYFVFTDDQKILNSKNPKIHGIFQEVEQWPFPTLHRFEYFLKQKEELLKMDYVLFMNANLIVKKKILENEVLPQNDEKLFVTLSPGFYNKVSKDFTYDRNPECSAYIPEGQGNYYFAGGLNGGHSKDFIEMSEIISKRITADYEKGIIALWHDESHINKYMFEFKDKYKILSPAYLYPQGWDIPFEKKIIILDKSKKGGHNFLRNIDVKK